MGQHYLSQPAKVPFIQQHMMMAAQNPMLQHQMQNASMSVNQHESPHHLSAQHVTAVITEINGMYVLYVHLAIYQLDTDTYFLLYNCLINM